MAYETDPAMEAPPGGRAGSRLARQAAVWAFVAVLAWAPFPLGSAVSWGAGLLEMLIAGCWLLWLGASWTETASLMPRPRAALGPLIVLVLVLLWALVQTLAVVPAGWAHPVWQMASDAIGRPASLVVSLNPWRTGAEILKLAAAIAACVLACAMAQRAEAAATLHTAIIAICTAYVAYAFGLAWAGVAQGRLIYGLPIDPYYMSGPFMLHNSFATYAGIGAVAAIVKLFDEGGNAIVGGRGIRQFWFTLIQYFYGRGAVLAIAAIALTAGVVASASRGGFFALGAALAVIALLSLAFASKSASRLWPAAGLGATVLPILVVIVASGDKLGLRVGQFADEGSLDATRLALWDSARRMIGDAPWTGLGLGTFQDAYPLYAVRVYPFVMDKAHNDYLEFAAGMGLPAALAWWLAMAWLAALLLRGISKRRRHRQFAMTAFGATVLVATHAVVDFSLQMPAVAVTYAALLGIGLAQSSRSRGA